MDITQRFYDKMASEYDKLFLDWESTTHEQAAILKSVFTKYGLASDAQVLDCACGIGTQAIGLARLGYRVSASDISDGELTEAEARAERNHVHMRLVHADFRNLDKSFSDEFDAVIAMDNALPHMLTNADLAQAIKSMVGRIRPGGIFVASIRDYDSLLESKPPYSAPYVHETDEGQRVSFQTWKWSGENYRFVQYIIDDGDELSVSKYECEYRATRRRELTELLSASGCYEVTWLMPEESGFYQPIVIARKPNN